MKSKSKRLRRVPPPPASPPTTTDRLPLTTSPLLTAEQAERMFGVPPALAMRLEMDWRWLMRPFRLTVNASDSPLALPVSIGGIEIGKTHLVRVVPAVRRVGVDPVIEVEVRIVPNPDFDGTDLLKVLYGQVTDE